jgi:hypothetical protein
MRPTNANKRLPPPSPNQTLWCLALRCLSKDHHNGVPSPTRRTVLQTDDRYNYREREREGEGRKGQNGDG